MKRAARQRLWLLAVVIVLVVIVLWQGAREEHRAPHSLTQLDPAAITRIELTIAQGTPQVFEKRGGHWWRVKPISLRGNDERLQHLANLAATPVARWIRGGEFDADKIGLSPPSATLLLDGQALRYGALSALDNLRYVAVGDRVALVPREDSPEMTLSMKPAR